VWGCGGRAGGGGGGARAGPAAGRVSLCGGPAQATGWLVPVRGGGACRAVSGGLRSGAALVGVRLDVGPLPPRFSLPAVAGCRMGGFPAGRGRWGGERVVGGVLARISVGAWGLCGRLCLVLVCRGGYWIGLSFTCSFRNKNEPPSIYPPSGYYPPRNKEAHVMMRPP
jgi:hypothetical protein